MVVETLSDRRLEEEKKRLIEIEKHLKKRLSEQSDTMHVKGGGEATLLEIYGEWMDFLVKQNLKGKSDLLPKWKNFLLMRNTDIVADLVKAFFAAKRRYGRDLERGEIRWSWFALCDNYCKRYGHNDDNLIKSFFSSYSGAEKRIYNKIVKGEVLASTSESLFAIMDLAEEEMHKKELDKKIKEEEKKKQAEEKKRQKEEQKARKAEEKKREAEEKKRQKEEQKVRKAEEKRVNKLKKIGVVNIVEDEQDDDREPDVDPDFPNREGWTGPVVPGSETPEIPEDIRRPKLKKKSNKPKKKGYDDAQGVIEFPE